MPITLNQFDYVYSEAIHVLPNNNIINIISKAKQPPYQYFILKLFQTNERIDFRYDNSIINYLYMNGIIDIEKESLNKFVRFSSLFVQKRLFNYFFHELFSETGRLTEPFEIIDHAIDENCINIKNLMQLYEKYLKKNKGWLLKNAPTRKDLRIFEAVYHFNLYMYLYHFLLPFKAQIWPEFPTGNGNIDLIVKYSNQIYGIELKSFTNEKSYRNAITKCANYALQLNIKRIALVFFVDTIDEENRKKFEKIHQDEITGVEVETIFIGTQQRIF